MEAIVAVYTDWGIGSEGTQPIVVPEDRRRFAEITKGATLIVGYNVAFDLAFVRVAGISCGNVPVFDVMREFAPVVGRRRGGGRDYSWVPLERCARHYGIRFRAHDALEDARATLCCFWAMLERGPARGSSAAAKSYLSVVADYASEKSHGGV